MQSCSCMDARGVTSALWRQKVKASASSHVCPRMPAPHQRSPSDVERYAVVGAAESCAARRWVGCVVYQVSGDHPSAFRGSVVDTLSPEELRAPL